MKRGIVVPHDNIMEGLALGRRVVELAGMGLGCFGVITGPSGTGKTFLGEVLLSEVSGIALPAAQSWVTGATRTDQRTMLVELLKEIGDWYPSGYSVHQLYQELIEQIYKREIKLIIIDEGDYLALRPRHELLNLLRDVADRTHVAILFLSVLDLAKRFAKPTEFTETLTSRTVGTVEFRRPSIEDAMLFAKTLVENVTLKKDLVAWCLRASRASVRGLLRLFAEIELAAGNAGHTGSLSLKEAVEFRLGPVPTLLKDAPVVAEPAPEQKPAEHVPIVGTQGLRVVA